MNTYMFLARASHTAGIFKRLGLVFTAALFVTGCNLFACGCGVPPDHLDLGEKQTVSVGATVTLEAKQIISYRDGKRAIDLTSSCLIWTFEGKPDTSKAQLEQSCKNPKVTFIPDAVGDYGVRAEIVYDDGHKGVYGRVSITANPLSSSQSER